MEKEVVLGIDIGGTNIRAGLVDKNNSLNSFECMSSVNILNDDAVTNLIKFVEDYCMTNLDSFTIKAVSIGFPSTINKERTKLLSTPNIKGLDDIDIVEIMEYKLKIPVFIERDVNMLFMFDSNYHKISSKGIVIGCYIGTGLGNAISINGEIIVGKSGVAAELGHTPIMGRKQICSCGNEGCCEIWSSGKGLEKLSRDCFPDTDISDIFTKHSDEKNLEDYIDILSIPIATEINILDPDYVILGGGVVSMNDFPIMKLKSYILKHTRKPYPYTGLQLLYSPNSHENGVLGAGLYAFKKLGILPDKKLNEITLNLHRVEISPISN